jgi:ABC-type Co2+ transport system permease subunit
MFNHSIVMFIFGWALWFAIDKHPAALGAIVPAQSGDMLANFQLAVDMLKAGYWKASFVFLWKAHYIVLSLIAGLMTSFVFRAVSNLFRQRKLREVMRPETLASDKTDSNK